jgi:hypothetical protein
VPYVIPSFNLFCNIWSYPAYVHVPPAPAPGTARVLLQPCALVYGKRTNGATAQAGIEFGFSTFFMNLLLPALTDIRGPQDTVGPDLVEVPAGSGRFYAAFGVDDIGKGWPNEHRTAALSVIDSSWTAPYP